jgi:hypothetical protein
VTGTTYSVGGEGAAAFRRLAADHQPLIVVVSAYAIVGLVAQRLFGLAHMMDPLAYVPTYAYFLSVSVYSVMVLLLWCRWQIRGANGERVGLVEGWRRGLALFGQRFGTVERAGGFVLVSILLPIFINTTLCWKAAIPRIQPFAWDADLARADLALHFGMAPWRLLQPVLGHPVVTWVVDRLYYLWIPLVTGLVYWQVWNPHREERARFFLTYTVGWIVLGTVLATLLSSAGPCYYASIVGDPGPYGPLMDYLRAVNVSHPLISIEVQGILWHQYRVGAVTPWNAISAMPSIHVAMPVVFTLVGRRFHKGLGAFFLVYGILVFIGSIHLGWHYAVDGYVSVIVMLAVWWWSGRVVRRHLDHRAADGPPA